MNRFLSGGVVAALVGLAGQAQGAIVFSNVTIAGSLSAGAGYSDGPNGISFTFPDAQVGDPVDPIRSGNIVITYNVEGTQGETFSQMLLAAAGALSGSGMMFINELVEDLNGGGVLGTYNAVLTDNSQLPLNASFDFSKSSGHIRVKKTFVLAAVDTNAFDLAQITQVDQLPTPGSVSLLAGAGLLAAAYRRRR
jgi:hypothetical protein